MRKILIATLISILTISNFAGCSKQEVSPQSDTTESALPDEVVTDVLDDTEAKKAMHLSYEIPSDYIVRDIDESLDDNIALYYENTEPFKTITVDYFEGQGNSHLEDIQTPDEEVYTDIEVYSNGNGISGVLCKDKATEVYCFLFISGDDYYDISGDEKEDVEQLVDSIAVVE